MIKVTLTESQILGTPNDSSLGELARQLYWQQRSDQDRDPFDPCVQCGRTSPYRMSTHIDLRIGYVEGAGQGCFQPSACAKTDKFDELTRGLH